MRNLRPIKVAQYFCTSNINDGWWETGKVYSVFIYVMTDGRLQFFDTSVKSDINLRIYDSLDQIFSDFMFSDGAKEVIQNNYNILKTYCNINL